MTRRSRGVEAMESRRSRRALTPDHLTHFVAPLTWPQILAIDPTRTESWWTDAIIEADEYGRGLIRWDKSTSTWVLTEIGCEAVCGVRH